MPNFPDPEVDISTPCLDGFDRLTTKEKVARAEIIHRAFSIWESQGRPDGRQLANWLQAEGELLDEAQHSRLL